MGGEFLEGEFFRGPASSLEKTESNNSTQEFGSKFGRPKFVSQNSALNSGSGGAKSPAQTLAPEKLTLSGLNGVSERGFGKTNLPLSRLIKILYLRGENCLQNAHFYKQKGPCLKTPLIWTGSVFPLLINTSASCPPSVLLLSP